MPAEKTAEYRIRPATRNDLPDLARMRTCLRDFMVSCDPDVWHLSTDKVARLPEFYADIIARPTGRVFLALNRQDRPVGMLMVRILENSSVEPSRFGRIDDAWVESAHRRKGVMRLLTLACAEFLEAKGVERVLLDYALRNPVSELCWKELGFEPVVAIANSTVSRLRQSRNKPGPAASQSRGPLPSKE